MNLKEIEKFKQVVENKKPDFMDLFELVHSGKIVPIVDEQDNVIGYHQSLNKPTIGKLVKVIDGVTFRGDSKEDLEEDIANYQKIKTNYLDVFGYEFVQEVINLCFKLHASDITPDAIYTERGIFFAVVKDRKIYDPNYRIVCQIDDSEIDENTSDKVILKLLELKLQTLI